MYRIKMSLQSLKEHLKPKLPKSILSPVTVENIVFSIRWGGFWGGLPFEYDKTKNLVIVTKEAVRFWRIVTWVQGMNFLYFLGVVIVSIIFREDVRKSKSGMFDVAFAFVTTMVYGVFLATGINVGVGQRKEFCSFVNNAMNFCIHLKENYTNHFGGRWRNGCEEIMTVVRFLSIILPFLSTLHFLQHPEKTIYITSLVPRDCMFYPFAYIGYGILRLILQIGGFSTILGIAAPVMGFVFCFLSVIEELKPGRTVYRTKPSFRKPETLRIIIRAVQIIQIQINTITRAMLMADQTLVTYTATVCAFSVIRFWDELTISAKGILVLTALNGVGIWSTALTIAAHSYTRTEKAFNSWRNYNTWNPLEKKMMMKFRKSIRPIQLEFGGFYYIRPKKILSFWNTLVWLVVRGLLTFPDNHQH